jgi:rubredoxin
MMGIFCASALAAFGLTKRSRSPAPAMQFGTKKKSSADVLEEQGYWPGEWCCADCGYIYEPNSDLPFEELRRGWKCPQCAGPRRRFVKKAGGITAAVDDTPLVVGTLVTAVVMAALVYVGLTI